MREQVHCANKTNTTKTHPLCKDTARYLMSSMTSSTLLCPGNCPAILFFNLLLMTSCTNVKAYSIHRHNDLKTYVIDGVTCFKCGPGSYVTEHCKTSFASSQCALCPDGQFQSEWTRATRCDHCKTSCLHDEKYEIVRNCTATSDTKCECKSGFYEHMADAFSQIYVCKRWKTCPFGKVVVQKGTSTSDSVCGECPSGQFYNSGQCEMCTQCPELNMTQSSPCTRTEDTVCQGGNETSVSLPVTVPVSSTSVVLDYTRSETSSLVTVVVVLPLSGFVTASLIIVYLVRKSRNSPSINNSQGNGPSPKLQRQSSFTDRHLLQRTLSNTSDTPTHIPDNLPSLQEYPRLKEHVFDFLCKRLATNWKEFMRKLPGDEKYVADIPYRCEQIAHDHRDNVREQIYTALREWSQAHGPEFVNLPSIVQTLKSVDKETGCDLERQIQSWVTGDSESWRC